MLGGLDPRTRISVDQSVGLGLIELTAAEEAHLLVFGSSHRGTVGRILLGSTVESVLHGVAAAIAVAPRGYAEREPAEPARIGVAYDRSPESELALETAMDLAEAWSCELTLVGVADYPRYDYAEAWTVLSGGGLHDFEREAHRDALEAGLAKAKRRVSATTELMTGRPGPILAGASGDFDLLVAGSRGYGPVRRTLLGSTTRRLMADSSCPVLVTPRGSGDDPLEPAGT